MPNILDDIIASVVENKIPPNRAPKINVKSEIKDEPKDDRKCIQDDSSKLYSDIPYSWICDKHVLWLRDHKNNNNWKLFKECWKQGRVGTERSGCGVNFGWTLGSRVKGQILTMYN